MAPSSSRTYMTLMNQFVCENQGSIRPEVQASTRKPLRSTNWSSQFQSIAASVPRPIATWTITPTDSRAASRFSCESVAATYVITESSTE